MKINALIAPAEGFQFIQEVNLLIMPVTLSVQAVMAPAFTPNGIVFLNLTQLTYHN
ncbi:hypothetical protein [Mesobacillus harenae]|uniref:hypothetical protein n=1 Tax=Mesobacillus harenae TaxID=2213203 RepID=UPI00158009A8|nr:hypothetical protein [Mesobacillus harenae]